MASNKALDLINAFWYISNNFGDNMNYYLIKAISGREPVIDRLSDHYIVCGSILAEANSKSTVWGAGFANYGESIPEDINIVAVRGHLTAEALNKELPVGDPALLMPLFYTPKSGKKYKVGFIPHWLDVHNVEHIKCDLLINPLKPVIEVIEDIVSCELIISSSLHGLILADAYGIPNKWVSLGTKIGGDGFKFHDYYSTTNRPKECSGKGYWVSEYLYDKNDFLNTCPFK